MKRFTLILSLMVAMVTTAMAQFEEGVEYRLKDFATGYCMNVKNTIAHPSGAQGGVNVVALDEDSEDQIFTAEAATDSKGNSGYKLKSKTGYYIVGQSWNVDACTQNADGASVFMFEETTGGYYIHWYNPHKGYDCYFKASKSESENALYPYGDASKAQAATWVITRANLTAAEILKIDFQTAIDIAKEMEFGTLVGEYTQDAIENVLRAAISEAETVIGNADATEVEVQNAYDTFVAAVNNLQIVMPEDGGFYRITKYDEQKKVAYAKTDNSCTWGESTTPASIWVFEAGSEYGKFYLKNLATGSYVTSYSKNSTVVLGEKTHEVTIVNHRYNRQVGIAPNGGEQLNRASGRLCVWTDNPAKDSNCAWIIEKVDPATISHTLNVTTAEWSTLVLGFNATIPTTEGFKAYTVSSIEDGYVALEEATGVLKANTAIIVNAPAEKYDFAYSANEATVTESLLDGSLYNKNITPEGTAYVLGNLESNVGLYKAEINVSTDTTNDGTEEAPAVTYEGFLNNANKAYLVVPASEGAEAASYSFRFGEETTGISEVKGENGNVKVIYDLTGRRVENITAPGIYVVGGKKVLVK